MTQRPAPSQTSQPASAESLQRRRVVLGALGKGVAVAGAATPLYAHASRNIVTSTGQQCTVSGFQSAAVSATAESKQTCGAFHPRYFFTVGPSLTISSTTDTSYTNDRLAAENFFDDDMNALSGDRAVGAVFQINGKFFIRTSSSSFRRVTPANWPAGVLHGATLNSIFPGAPNGERLALAQLYDWSVSNTAGESAYAYFIAAYFNALMTIGPAGTVNVPFDGEYVKAQVATNEANALIFFKDLCVSQAALLRPAP